MTNNSYFNNKRVKNFKRFGIMFSRMCSVIWNKNFLKLFNPSILSEDIIDGMLITTYFLKFINTK